MRAFGNAIPGGTYMLMFIVICFALSSMFSYSYYGTSCATYLFGAPWPLVHLLFCGHFGYIRHCAAGGCRGHVRPLLRPHGYSDHDKCNSAKRTCPQGHTRFFYKQT